MQADKEKVSRGFDLVAGLLGPAGALVAAVVGLWQQRKSETGQVHDDDGGPETSPYQDENSFSIYVPEIRDAALEPPGLLTVSEKQAGRLHLVRDGKTVKLALPTADDVQSVLNLLAPMLKSNLRIKGEWDAGARQFQKKRKLANTASSS